jgi:mRNA interferase MazF
MEVNHAVPYVKDFDAWAVVKKKVHAIQGTVEEQEVVLRAGEVRWAHIGVNIGSEIDGKGDAFTRPVLVMHVVGHTVALVVPLTSKIKKNAGYVPFKIHRSDLGVLR